MSAMRKTIKALLLTLAFFGLIACFPIFAFIGFVFYGVPGFFVGIGAAYFLFVFSGVRAVL